MVGWVKEIHGPWWPPPPPPPPPRPSVHNYISTQQAAHGAGEQEEGQTQPSWLTACCCGRAGGDGERAISPKTMGMGACRVLKTGISAEIPRRRGLVV